MKETPLSRMTGYKTSVTYFKFKSTGGNDYLSSSAGIGTLDPNKLNLIQINEFVILCQGEVSTQTQTAEIGTDIAADGQMKILPRTIKPSPNEYFLMETYGKRCLYRVTNVNKTTMEDDSAYEVTYALYEEKSDEKLNEILACVTEKYYFVYSHVGTSFRTLFKEDEYKAIEKLDLLHRRIGQLYNEYFYNLDKNTYVLEFNSLVKKTVIDVPYSIAVSKSEVQEKGTYVQPPKLNGADTWYGSHFYDRMLIEFITRNKMFAAVDRKIFRVTQLRQDIEKWYSGTIFYAVESQTIKRLKFKYLLPSPITRVTVASTLNLYGLVSLEPLADKLGSSIELYPAKLIPYLLWEIKERSVSNVLLNTYEDALELMCEAIGLYANKKEDVILSRLLLLYDHMDELLDSALRDQDSFYVFPLLSYVILKTMDRLSDQNFGLNVC